MLRGQLSSHLPGGSWRRNDDDECLRWAADPEEKRNPWGAQGLQENAGGSDAPRTRCVREQPPFPPSARVSEEEGGQQTTNPRATSENTPTLAGFFSSSHFIDVLLIYIHRRLNQCSRTPSREQL